MIQKRTITIKGFYRLSRLLVLKFKKNHEVKGYVLTLWMKRVDSEFFQYISKITKLFFSRKVFFPLKWSISNKKISFRICKLIWCSFSLSLKKYLSIANICSHFIFGGNLLKIKYILQVEKFLKKNFSWRFVICNTTTTLHISTNHMPIVL